MQGMSEKLIQGNGEHCRDLGLQCVPWENECCPGSCCNSKAFDEGYSKKTKMLTYQIDLVIISLALA